MYYLQNRWKLVGKNLIYCGIRLGENLNKNKIKLTKMQANIIVGLPRNLTLKEQKNCKKLLIRAQFRKNYPKKLLPSLRKRDFAHSAAQTISLYPDLSLPMTGFAPCVQA